LTRAESILGSKTLIAFDHINGCLESVAIRPCGFMRLRGAFATKPEGLIPLGPEPGLNLVVSTHVDVDGLWTALNSLTYDDTTEAGVTLRDVWGLRLWLALREPLFCDLYAEGDAARRRLVPFLVGQVDSFAATFGLCEETTLCVLMRRPEQVPPPDQPVDLDKTFDLMVRCFGPGKRLAQSLLASIAAWNASDYALTTGLAWTLEADLRMRAYPHDTEYVPTVDEVVIDKQWTRLVCNWQ
jgi:protein-L-isoaspartate(D-aspartate) O-methyltransferase